MKKILVPLRLPITSIGRKTLAKAIEIAKGEECLLFIYHINMLYQDGKVTNAEFKKEVLKNASELKDMKQVFYSVDDSYLLDESILKKISDHDIDTVIMGKSMIPRWRKFIQFWGHYKISDEIKKAAECRVIVVE